VSGAWEAGALDRLLARGGDPLASADTGSLLAQLANAAAAGMRSFISRSEAPDGSAFAPLKRPRRPPHNPDPRPLIDSGDLFNSIHGVVLDARTAAAGHGKLYGVFQNDSTRTIPSRRFVGVDADLLAEFGALIGPWAVSEVVWR